MLAPNPWHPPEREDEQRDGAFIMMGCVILLIAAFGGALLASLAFALLR